MKKILPFLLAIGLSDIAFPQIGEKRKDTSQADLHNKIDTEPVKAVSFLLYTIYPKEGIHGGKGRLTAYLPKDTTMTVTVFGDKFKIPFPIQSLLIVNWDTVNVPVDLMPATYHVKLNGVPVDVPVEKGKETRLKAGFLIITSKKKEVIGAIEEFEWSEGLLFEPTYETWIWTLRKMGAPAWKITGKKGTIFALPPGEYSLFKEPPFNHPGSQHFKIFIKDGQWVVNGEKQ